MVDFPAAFPQGNQPLVDRDGQITRVWRELLVALYNRTGSGGGGTVISVPVTIPNGGTGATSAATARSNLGAVGQSMTEIYAVMGGSANAQTLNVSPAIAAYADGQVFHGKVTAGPNTGATTLSVNGLAAVNVVDVYGNSLNGYELQVGMLAEFWYLGGNFILAQSAWATGEHFFWTKAVTATTNIDFDPLPSGFARFRFDFQGVQPNTVDDQLAMRVFQASSIITTNTYNGEVNDLAAGANTPTTIAAANRMLLSGTCDGANGKSIFGSLELMQPDNSSMRKMFNFMVSTVSSGGGRDLRTGMGFQDSNTALSGVRFYPSSGSWNAAGYICCRGFRGF